MEQAESTVLPIKQGLVLDILDQQAPPALSSTSDMPVIETKPDSTPAPKEPEKETAVPEKAEQSSESATDATEEESGQQTEEEKIPRGVGKALAELRQQRREAEARAKAAEENLRLALERQKPAEPEPIQDELVKPTRDTYSDPDAYDAAMLAYAEALAESRAKREVEKMRAEEAEKARTAAEEVSARARLDAYNARVEKARQAHADFDEVAKSPDVQVSMPVVHAIMTHDQGPEIQYYLGEHPAEAARILAMTVETPSGPQPDIARQLMEVGLIVAKLNAPQVQAQPVTKAAPPIKPLKSTPAPEDKDPAEMSMPEYAAWRKGQRH